MKQFILFLASSFLLFSSCKKDSMPPYQAGDTGTLEIEFDNVMGDQNLELNSGTYTNASGESYSISHLDYFISNIVLKNQNGPDYTVPKDSSYFLIREENPSQLISLTVPAGDYTGISFTIGIDSLKSVSPIEERKGVLDTNGEGAEMYRGDNSGYIFLKMEGNSTAITGADKSFKYDIGGYGGHTAPTINNIRSVSLQAPSGKSAMVRKNKPSAPHIHVFADAEKILDGSTKISIAAHSSATLDPFSATIADNYSKMFKIDHIHND